MIADPARHSKITVRPLVENDLSAADRVIRLAFGTFLGMADPTSFMGDADFAYTRWKADPSSVLAAEENGKLIGSNFASNWGSFAFFGPLTVEPEYWNRGVAQQLLPPTMEIFRGWGNRHMGLFTFPASTKHIGLYRKFGFWPRDLVANMTAKLDGISDKTSAGPALFSSAKPRDRSALLIACREVTDAIFDGLDVEREICAVVDQKLGDTILLWDLTKLAGFAVCHTGAGTEAGSGSCYIKFAAVRPGAQAHRNFARLINEVKSFARACGVEKIASGVNMARREAFLAMVAAGFRVEGQGIAMETGDANAGYNRAGVYILDDWR